MIERTIQRIPQVMACSVLLLMAGSAFAQQNNQKQAAAPQERPRPQSPLFFRETWKVVPGAPVEHPVTQASVANPNLELKLYGPSGKDIQENGGPDVPNNPTHLWTGLCAQPCGMALRDKNNYVDLSGLAKINWYTKVTGLHQLHPIVKLADGTWLLGEHGDGTVYDYHTNDFTLSETRWIKLDIEKLVTRGRWLDKVDLSKVDEVGFTDLMPGSGHGDGGYSDLGLFEVYGKPVPRNGGQSQQQ